MSSLKKRDGRKHKNNYTSPKELQLPKRTTTPKKDYNSQKELQLPKITTTPKKDYNSQKGLQLPKRTTTPKNNYNAQKDLQLPKRTTTPRPLPVADNKGGGKERSGRRFSGTGMQRREDGSVSPGSWSSREG